MSDFNEVVYAFEMLAGGPKFWRLLPNGVWQEYPEEEAAGFHGVFRNYSWWNAEHGETKWIVLALHERMPTIYGRPKVIGYALARRLGHNETAPRA